MNSTAADASAIAAARLRQEAQDLRDRSRPSGVFYLIGWLVVGAISGAFEHQPLGSALLTLLLISIALLRLRLRVPEGDSAPQLQAFVRRCWALIFTNVGSWSAITLWTLHANVPTQARTAALICTIMYGSAFGYAYCMRQRHAVAGLLIIAGPATLSLWTMPDQWPIAFAFSIYLLHLLLVTGTSYRSYQQRLDLDAQLRQQRNLYEQLSRIDALSGLFNRGHFNGQLRELTAGGGGAVQGFAFALLDIDHFKRINDTHGHAAGDRCLQQLADSMRAVFSEPGDYLARIGGEEFAILLPGHDAERALERVRVLRTRLRDWASQGELALTVSAGLGVCHAGERISPEALYHAVDGALYRAKSGGRDRVCPVLAANVAPAHPTN